ncbi:HAD-like domain [Pseudocohnilembus persalinus]|uniref:HAD-like domain n=1 Tax=Pseudocohnilembus persalinus TaxID=266149 RepID=A0A0V0QCP9_PSEPJ|nr:HAD-like domain [Pseudocohnilembus persalinus]|eukprot:KRX00007.1 HAD-like domain [Pseudocohnilembus persalinus]
MDENLFRQECKIQFELECQTQFKEEVFIVGDIPELGNWNPFNALKMITSQKDYPIWKLPQELIIPTHKKIEFKFIKKFEDSNQHNWEQFPNQMNRKYYTRYNKVVLQVMWNDYDGREIVYQRFQILPSQDRILDNFTKLQCKKQVISDTFDPFERAQDSDSDSSEEYSGGASDDFEYQYDDEDDSYYPDQNNMNNNLISMNNERNNIPVQYNQNNSPILEGDINLDNQYDLLQIDQEFNQQENFNQLQFQPDNNLQLLEQDNKLKNVDLNSNKNEYNQVVQQITNEIQKQNQNLINENIVNEKKTQIDQNKIQDNIHLKEIIQNCENENVSPNTLQQKKSLNIINNSVKQRSNLDLGSNNLNKYEKKQQAKQVEEVQKQKNNKTQISQNNQQNQQKNPKVLDQRGTGNEYFLEKQESMGELEEEIKSNLLYLQNNLVQNKSKYQQLQQQKIQLETVENRYRNENQHVSPEQEKFFIQNQQTEIHSEQKINKDFDDSPSQQVIKDSYNNTDNIQSNIQFDKLKDIYKMYGSKNLKNLYDLVGESNNDFYNFKHSEMDNILFCHFFLPLKIIFSDASDQWSIQFDDDTLLYHYYQAFPNSIFIGIISNYYEFSPDQWPQIEEELRNYNCLPVFIENEKIDKFLLEFCYPVLDPMMNNELDGTDMTLENTKTELWELFQEICKKFSEAIRKLQNENSYIFFLDHRILLTISYISFYTVKPSILYFSYGKFPHIQTFSIFPYHKDLINAILNADLINFIEYEQSINFFPIVRQIYGIKLYSRRGILQFNMQGRNIVVNMKHPELPKEFLDIWFSKVPNLGLACESGYIYKVVKQKTPLQKIKQIIEKNQNNTKQQIWTKENQSSIQLDEFQHKGEIKLKELNKILMEKTLYSNNAITSNLSQQNGQSKDNENESENQTANAKENDLEMDKEKQINKKNSQLSFLLKKSLILKDLKERTLQRSHSGSKEYFIQNPSINLNQTREQSIKNTKIDNYEEQNSEDWEYLKDIDVSWKVKVLQVMENFVLRTQGSKIFNKESSIIWSCQGVNQIFAQKQQEKLIEQLNIVTEEYDVQIIIQNTMVEVRSYGINKGTFIDLIIVQKYVKQGPIDFILCCGRGPSGEEMFQSIQKNLLKNEILHYFRENINVYPVVVDLKPSHANYYIKDQKHMENLLYVLSHKVQDN